MPGRVIAIQFLFPDGDAVFALYRGSKTLDLVGAIAARLRAVSQAVFAFRKNALETSVAGRWPALFLVFGIHH
jgi:23S rRNA U2552 (ribose-2'-O)-methylase RlmE/FtsJ